MKCVDLFSGCGGMSLGFLNAGFDVIAAFDNWDAAITVYKDNFDHPIHKADLSDYSSEDLIGNYHPDIIIGGPPCQDFSSAGKRDETLGRADLTICFANFVGRLRPQWFVMENVERITKSGILKEARAIFKDAGYGLSSRVLNASLCGVPQLRKRFFLVGLLNAHDGFLDFYLDKNLADKPMSVADYMGDKLDVKYYYRHPRSYHRRAVFGIDEPSPTIRGVNRPIPKTYKFHQGDACKTRKKIRPLTTAERALIQTYPESFKFQGSKSEAEQMIGNAVPVKLAEYVAKCISEYIRDHQNNNAVAYSGQLQFNYE